LRARRRKFTTGAAVAVPLVRVAADDADRLDAAPREPRTAATENAVASSAATTE
jgi:hypothetical protein